MEKEIKPFIELFKDMSEPNNYDRLSPAGCLSTIFRIRINLLKI